MKPAIIALVGDHSASVSAHQAIPRALESIRASDGCDLKWRWVGTPRWTTTALSGQRNYPKPRIRFSSAPSSSRNARRCAAKLPLVRAFVKAIVHSLA